MLCCDLDLARLLYTTHCFTRLEWFSRAANPDLHDPPTAYLRLEPRDTSGSPKTFPAETKSRKTRFLIFHRINKEKKGHQRKMCFGVEAEPRRHYYYHEEITPARKHRSHHHHHHGRHHHHSHRHHSPHTSYSSVSSRSCSTGPRVSVPSMYESRRGRVHYV